MATIESQRRGGQVMAQRQRELAIKIYYENPNICKNCGKVIEIKDGDKVCQIKQKIFCNRFCSAKYNSPRRPRKSVHENFCIDCGTKIGKTNHRCSTCDDLNRLTLSKKTKKELFLSCKNWQSARSTIRKHAINIFENTNQDPKCYVCGYKLHVEICHKKSVADFPESATIGEINEINNLVALCPTHHWEFDNGHLKL